ncbi:MAG: glycoside hydrolase family 3 protein [Alphaproteobacteria bacterium]|nr:MAG: glycoside hydrolase family 3 protein [Alphaproteobacteria bacterium]
MFLFAHNLIIGFEGTNTEHACVKKMLNYAKQNKIKGVIIFRRNIYNYGQLKRLTQAFKQAKPDIEIASDEEGCWAPFKGVSRLYKLVGPVPSALQMAKNHTPEEAYKIYRKYAQRLKNLGITMVFGPVADLHSDTCPAIGKYERAFSSDPKKVIAYAKSFIRAFKDEGIKTVVKHYPGHGLSCLDTHAETTNVTQTWQKKEAIPFRALSKYTPYVMMAHIIDDKVDKDVETSLSAKHYANARAMGYKHLITDDLHMGGVQIRHQPIIEAIRKALAMGAIVIASNMPKSAPNFKFEPDFDLPDKL